MSECRRFAVFDMFWETQCVCVVFAQLLQSRLRWYRRLWNWYDKFLYGSLILLRCCLCGCAWICLTQLSGFGVLFVSNRSRHWNFWVNHHRCVGFCILSVIFCIVTLFRYVVVWEISFHCVYLFLSTFCNDVYMYDSFDSWVIRAPTSIASDSILIVLSLEFGNRELMIFLYIIFTHFPFIHFLRRRAKNTKSIAVFLRFLLRGRAKTKRTSWAR